MTWVGRLRGAAWAAVVLAGPVRAAPVLLNVSYDPTREFYHDFDQDFAAWWRQRTGQAVTVQTVNGGSGAEARAVLSGVPADVVTLALAADIDLLVQGGKVKPGWAGRLPDQAVPYTSVVVLLVRKGNPRGIRDWGDLVRGGVQVVTPDPDTSGGGRWNFLAALGYAQRLAGASEESGRDFLRRLYGNVVALDPSTRAATDSFVQRGMGDVLIGSENEARRALQAFGGAGLEIVYPSITVLEEAPVAVVDATVQRDNNRDMAEAYLRALWSPAAQELAARHFFRPRDPHVAQRHAAEFPRVTAIDVTSFGGWGRAQAEDFGAGGVYERIRP